MPKDDDVLVNVAQAQDELGGCSRQHIYNLVRDNKLHGLTVGIKRGLRIYLSSIKKYKKQQETSRKAA